ncbi:MAG: zinc ribbon domain-containing protein [Ferruginibacter sp.]|nr:zinc ribbon domain-containing protein [Cytophagales bacterium]
MAKTFQFLMYDWQLAHPQVVYRAKGLDQWIRSGAYERILSGKYVADATGGAQLGQQVSCVKCKKTVSTTVQFCPECGDDLRQRGLAATTVCQVCTTPLPAGVKFCVNCGSAVS